MGWQKQEKGQAFADEIFRVFSSKNKEIQIFLNPRNLEDLTDNIRHASVIHLGLSGPGYLHWFPCFYKVFEPYGKQVKPHHRRGHPWSSKNSQGGRWWKTTMIKCVSLNSKLEF